MKIRTGFVSNSSSSSFVIVLGPNNVCPHCGRSDYDILDAISRSSSYTSDNEIDAEGKKDVISYIRENWLYNEGNDKLINKIEALGDEERVALVSISYHDEVLKQMLNQAENLKVLYSDEG